MDGQTGSQEAMSVYCVSRDWDQKTVTWFRAMTNINWTTEGIDFLSAPVARSARVANFVNQWETIAVTDHVKRWLANRAANYGFALVINDGAVEWIDWASSEYGDKTKRPKLSITYLSNSGPVPVSRQPSVGHDIRTAGHSTAIYGLDGRRMQPGNPETGRLMIEAGSRLGLTIRSFPSRG